jgi:hypothetical protein
MQEGDKGGRVTVTLGPPKLPVQPSSPSCSCEDSVHDVPCWHQA